MLRQLAGLGLNIGVNWYLAPDENHNADGKHIGYITDKQYNECDDSLRNALQEIAYGQSSVAALERMELVPNAVYYHEVLYSPSPTFSRRDWHKRALEVLSKVEIVFLDPDNGLLVKSVSAGSAKSNKYVFPSEIIDYYTAGESVIFYNHRCREQESVYIQRFAWLHEHSILKDAVIAGVTFKRGTVRDYVFILQPSHAASVLRCLDKMLQSPWGKHFTKLDLSNQLPKTIYRGQQKR